jgi:hypothetical protein
MKKCNGKCGIEKDDDQFSPSELKNKWGRCRECINDWARQHRAKQKKNGKKEKVVSPPGYKNCSSCNTIKSVEEFSFRDKKRGILLSHCKSCRAEHHKKYLKNKPPSNIELKVCYLCNLEKSIKDFDKNKNCCKVCRKLYDQEYFAKNKGKINEKNKKKRSSDPILKLRQNISSTINKMLNSKGETKRGASMTQYLNWTIKDLLSHLESLFSHPNNLKDGKVWMGWHNHGAYKAETHDTNPTWNIDHIIPQSDLPYSSMKDENFKICWSLENLRPLDAYLNILDGVHRSRHIEKSNNNGK